MKWSQPTYIARGTRAKRREYRALCRHRRRIVKRREAAFDLGEWR